MKKMVACPFCKKETMAEHTREMANLDGDETEGQEADYMAAESSGEYGDWAVDIYIGTCEHCKKPFILKVS